MATDFLGRELPDKTPTAQTVEDFAVERGNLSEEDVQPATQNGEQTTGEQQQDSTTE